ncbi:MAG: chemotaxis protein CheW [Sedimenticolaceae bacterium]
MSQAAQELRCMLIPLREGRLVLPNAAVAEVIGYRDPDPVGPGDPWLQGKVSWHQRNILVIDFERMLGLPVTGAGIRQRIVVCYALDADGQWPLLGLVAQGIPRLLRVNSEMIESASSAPSDASPVQMRLTIGGEDLMVPDLAYLQAQLPAA